MSLKFTPTAPSQLSPSGILDLSPEAGDLIADGLAGLQRSTKTLPSKYFYDKRGSELFETLTTLPEYYVTRTELDIMAESASEMGALLGEHGLLIEFGSGSGQKTRELLSALPEPAGCILIDISKSALSGSIEKLEEAFPSLPIFGVCADYTRSLQLPEVGTNAKRRIAYFPGSTLGNFSNHEARVFLQRTAALLGPGGALLLGVDRVKAVGLLERAYDDARGVTAAFNFNLLTQLNANGANFVLDRFRHSAVFNAAESRVEMHLVSQVEQTVELGSATIRFDAGESIRTEMSHKYTLEAIRELAGSADMTLEHHWSDKQDWFSVCYLSCR